MNMNVAATNSLAEVRTNYAEIRKASFLLVFLKRATGLDKPSPAILESQDSGPKNFAIPPTVYL